MALRVPTSLLSSADYQALNADQRRSLESRISYYVEIAKAGANAALLSGPEFLAAIDDLELDALSAMSAFSDPKTAVSPYRIHSSWLADCDRLVVRSHVSESTMRFLVSGHFLLDSPPEDLKRWLRGWAELAQTTERDLEGATSFSEVVSHLVVADAFLAALLLFVSAVRLSSDAAI